MASIKRIWNDAKFSASAFARRFSKARDGAAALEFAIVAFPFFLFLLAVIEIAYMFFLSIWIDNAALESSRKVRTGQMQYAHASAQDFFDDVCDNLKPVAPCDSHLFVDVEVYDDFGSMTDPPPIDEGEFDSTGLSTDFGEAGDIVLVRVYYVWDVFFPSLGTGLSNLSGGRRLMMSAVAFRNEPFGSAGAGGET